MKNQFTSKNYREVSRSKSNFHRHSLKSATDFPSSISSQKVDTKHGRKLLGVHKSSCGSEIFFSSAFSKREEEGLLQRPSR